MAQKSGILTPDIFRFFRELERNNNKPWMDKNRERYRTSVVEPFRQLLEKLAPAALKLDPNILITGRTGDNFSRINRDIRFARDKSPYRPHFYLFLQTRDAGEHGGSQLYLGVTKDGVTSGFRNYAETNSSALVQFGIPRGQRYGKWLARERKRLDGKYESYWHYSEKKEWRQERGWPLEADDWKKLQAWIVRRKFAIAAATKPGFPAEIAKVFRDVFPLYAFSGSATWAP
jgi:uncharacterized protein (TIGR02453 family)